MLAVACREPSGVLGLELLLAVFDAAAADPLPGDGDVAAGVRGGALAEFWRNGGVQLGVGMAEPPG